jgi:hypothetical protein
VSRAKVAKPVPCDAQKGPWLTTEFRSAKPFAGHQGTP